MGGAGIENLFKTKIEAQKYANGLRVMYRSQKQDGRIMGYSVKIVRRKYGYLVNEEYYD